MSTLTEKRNLIQEIQAAFVQRGLESHPKNRRALDLFLAKGLPGMRSEEYKFTPITRLLEKVLVLDSALVTGSNSSHSSALVPELTCNMVVFVNGLFSQERTIILDAGLRVVVDEGDDARADSDPFNLLNQAFCNSVVKIEIDAKATLDHPVAIVSVFDTNEFVFANPRWRCLLGEQSSACLIEYSVGTEKSAYLNNKQGTIEVSQAGQLEFITIQNGLTADIQLNNTSIHLADSAIATCHTFTLGGQFIRNNLSLAIEGSGVDARLYGLYLLSGSTLADNHTVVDHKMPNSYSNEIYKGVMDGNSRGVFNGKIYVRPQAQKTNAFQSNRNILLSETATINTKPQLEIWADDVKCSHGCTTGQLDEEALFYLRSRGISKDMAKGMLLLAFASETTAGLKNETVKNFLEGLISEKLEKSF